MTNTMNVIKATAGFPDGAGDFASLITVNDCLVGKRIVAVEYSEHYAVKFLFEDGASVSLTTAGIDGDDLDLSIEQPSSPDAWETNVMTQAQPATIAIRWSTIAAVAVGVCFGMVIGAVGVQQAIKQHPIQLEMFTADTTAEVCINGIAYEVGDAGSDSPWHGVYRPAQQGQPPLVGEDGQQVLRQVIPVRCNIGRE